MSDFCHLHCHTQYSLLDGASDIATMMEKAKNDGQSAVALTDHGNMFGAFKFVNEAQKRGIKPIVGCEFYLVNDRHVRSFEKSRGQKDIRYHQLLLAKNPQGYQNLSKLCSLGFTEGLYSKYPRIDKELILKYHEGIIATSCCLGAEIPQAIAHNELEKAEEMLKWWLDIFGEDYYIEIQRQKGLEKIDIRDESGEMMYSKYSQEEINQILLSLAKKYNVKVIATNDAHYVEREDAVPHDMLLCINTGTIIEETNRFKFASDDFYFKTKGEMSQVFKDLPFALENTMEIAAKVEELKLTRDVLLPAFPLPTGFDTQELYLRHLAFEGAKKRYGSITPQIEERLNFELKTINDSGYPGYFLIVQDFTSSARNMGVSVGPGRGSAAGSAIAYCLGITNIDPIKYDLLFERFLNPERVSMPDIDIDFDDEGRDKVIDYVIDKYGKNQVAQIITYGTMKAKSSIRDVGRVMNIPLSDVDRIAKTVPDALDITLNDVLAEGDLPSKLKENLNSDDLNKAMELRRMASEPGDASEVLKNAKKLEGSVRNTGIHACGVIITPEDITNFIPVSVAKDSDLLVSQYDNSIVESVGLLKMDFLGLKTLTIIKDAVDIVKRTKGVEINIDEVDLDDPVTYELFQKGETIGIFQYESPGMQKHLKSLKPNKFGDLIAMNALYRPGPMQYIDNFINRKHGREAITYDLPEMEEFLAETYGITVYQEQVMLLSQKLAGFSKGEADNLRKAMGKKKKDIIDKMFPQFIEGCKAHGLDEKICEKVWKDWEAFASYAFNKSHSTCYAYLAFQTGYLKAHYPEAFMASVLNHNKNDISKIKFFLDECKRMNIRVLGPDINESEMKFTVNTRGDIRFGLSGLKGVGEGPVEEILTIRNAEGPFTDTFDLFRRLTLQSVNKKALESLVLGGAFDSFNQFNRKQYFAAAEGQLSFVEQLIKYSNAFRATKNQSQLSLFGGMEEEMIAEPKPEDVEEWNQIEKLEKEKEVTGIYMSGHPLDDYGLEFKYFVSNSIDQLENIVDSIVSIGAIVTDVNHGVTQRGDENCRFVVQDYSGSLEIRLYNEQYQALKHLIEKGKVLYIEGGYRKGYNSDRVFYKVKDIKLLDTIGKQMTKSLTVKIPISDLDEKIVHGIEEIVESHKGKHWLKVKIVDQTNEHQLDMVAKGIKVNADHSLVKKLEELGLAYRIN
ncbi:MAG TPA: DNA polymerase III subunit alpha [Saprospiraceae bacterium]|nr:DNA polymerase III subunit alpha [Saprospiraceae bacterium]